MTPVYHAVVRAEFRASLSFTITIILIGITIALLLYSIDCSSISILPKAFSQLGGESRIPTYNTTSHLPKCYTANLRMPHVAV